MTEKPVVRPRVGLRKTDFSDLEYVTALEQAEENRRYVFQQTQDQHREMMASPDIAHLIVMRGNTPIGFMILAGLAGSNGSIELKRFVIGEKGLGYGREALRLCVALTFEVFNAHRLWLDVVDYNQRAIDLYLSAGFVKEGLLRECDLFEGEYASLVIMSMLRQEYEQRS